MRIGILTPRIKEKILLEERGLKGDDIDLFFLTNPLYQRKMLRQNQVKMRNIEEEELLEEESFEPINQRAKHFARNWFLLPEVQELLSYRGINLGSLFTHQLTYDFLGILKAVSLYKSLLSNRSLEKIYLWDDGSYWTETCLFVGKQKNVPIHIIDRKRQVVREGLGDGIPVKPLLKLVVDRSNRWFNRDIAAGGILYSSALRYALPLIQKGSGNYYLRDIFSWKAFRLSRKYSFYHILPQYFRNSSPLKSQTPDRERLWNQLKKALISSRFFEDRDFSLWPLVEPRLAEIVQEKFPHAMQLIDSFFVSIERLRPTAAVTDEDVCFFNKTLLACCNRAGIPTYTMVHGVPVFDIGSVPPTASKILVWGESCKNRLMEWGIEEERIVMVGAPQYGNLEGIDCKKSAQKVKSDFPIAEDSQILLLATQPFHTNERPDFLGTPLTEKMIETVVKITLKFLESFPKSVLIVKLHPRESNEWFTRQLTSGLGQDLDRRIFVVRDYETLTLIAASDLVLTLGSTVYFEALLFRKPVMIFDDPQRRYFKFIDSHFLDVSDHDACCNQLRQFFLNPAERTLVKNRQAAIGTHFYQSPEEAVRTVIKLCNP